jgi:hypothetical protein
VDDLNLPGYVSQLDPDPRQTANEQLQALAQGGFVRLSWLPGETGHLLEAVTLLPERAAWLFPWLERAPVAAQTAALRDLLLADRFRFAETDWRRQAVDHTLVQLRAGKSPPIHPANPDLTAICSQHSLLCAVHEETLYRAFSVRTNDSKAFERLRGVGNWPGDTGRARSDARGDAARIQADTPIPTHIYFVTPQFVSADG